MPVVSLQEAIDELPIIVPLQVDLSAAMDAWMAVFSPYLPTSGPPYYPFDIEEPNQRTVSNWYAASERVRSALPAAAWSQHDYEQVIDVVNRFLHAMLQAVDAVPARATTLQDGAVVAQFNIAFPSP